MIADIVSIEIFQTIVKELFIRVRKHNISLVFITQSYFYVPKDVRLNSTHYLIMKIIENYRILELIILQKLIKDILRKFTENVQKTFLVFRLLIQHYQQVIL